MALNPKVAANTANTMLSAAFAVLANGGFLNLYTGTQPDTADTAIIAQVELISFGLNATAFAAPSSGVMAANAIATAIAIATGTATWFRLFTSNGTTAIMDGSVGTSGCDVNLATTTITAGDLIGVTSFTVSLPLS
jgi:hypothetical protein